MRRIRNSSFTLVTLVSSEIVQESLNNGDGQDEFQYPLPSLTVKHP